MNESKETVFFDDSTGKQKGSSIDVINSRDSSFLANVIRDRSLAETALLLLEVRTVRIEQFGNSKFEIDDVSFHIMLDLLVSENIETPTKIVDLARTHNVGKRTMLRYIEYLTTIGLIAISKDTQNEDQVALELTESGITLCNDALKKIGNKLIRF